jgi:DNA-binding NarL/FixJ family response regulator
VIAQAVQAVLAGHQFFCATIARNLKAASELKAISETERRILELVAAGYEIKEIAAVLGLAYKTVLNDFVSIRRKTGIHSLVGLAEFAKMHGLAARW